MRKVLLSIVSLWAVVGVQAQDDIKWKKGIEGALQGSYTTFSTYYQAGGTPSVTLLGNVKALAHYKQGKHSWDNDFVGQLGGVRQGRLKNSTTPFVKSLDVFNITSKYGYAISPKLNVATYANFNTQWMVGYNKPLEVNRTVLSNFLSPGKVDAGVGMEWKPSDNFSVLYSPLNARLNIVTIDSLRTSLGNVKNEVVRFEVGSFLNAKYTKDLWVVRDGDKVKDWPKLTFSSSLIAFMGYLQYKNAAGQDVGTPFKPDITMWTNTLNFRVNKFLSLSYLINFSYDEDIQFKLVDSQGNYLYNTDGTHLVGAKPQFTQVFGVGLAYNWANYKK